MACACGKKNANLNYKVTFTDGTNKVYRTEVEAEAAKIRKGGGAVQAVPR